MSRLERHFALKNLDFSPFLKANDIELVLHLFSEKISSNDRGFLFSFPETHFVIFAQYNDRSDRVTFTDDRLDHLSGIVSVIGSDVDIFCITAAGNYSFPVIDDILQILVDGFALTSSPRKMILDLPTNSFFGMPATAMI